MARNIIFVDFDRTLFKTHNFTRDAWEVLGKTFNINAAHFIAEIPEWYRYIGDLRYYKFDSHMEASLGRPADELADAIRPELAKRSLMYPDATELFAWQKQGREVRIMTFGEVWFQTFKLSLVPKLKDIPCDIILAEKGEFIAEHFPDVTGFLIDDKRNQSLPPGVQGVWLDRTSHWPIKQESDIITVNSLRSIQEIL